MAHEVHDKELDGKIILLLFLSAIFLFVIVLQIEYFLIFKKSLLRHFYVALSLTVGLIAMSVVLLSVTPSVNVHTRLRALFLRLSVSWLMACFASYILLLRKSLS